MSFNYGKEKKIFIEDWKKKRAEYAEAGMSEEAISEMYAFDLEWFRSRRRFVTHTQTLTMEFSDYGPEEVPNSLVEKFEGFVTTQIAENRLFWIEDLDNDSLAEYLRTVSEVDLHILTSVVIEGRSQEEVAKSTGYSQRGISKRCAKLLKHLSDLSQ
ncbi:MAG: hypothetical protein R3Y54_07955 [Eubacteriales bacterium]